MIHFIAYTRTSTKLQNLGMNAQQTAITNYVSGVNGNLVATYSEQESGKNDNRIELEKAIQHCERTGATLLLYKLDRLSRSVSFLFQLRDRLVKSNVEIKVMDMPTFNTMTLGIYATLAQSEREAISLRTKNALQELKRKGVQLGTPENLKYEDRMKGGETMKLKALTNKTNIQATAMIVQLKNQGLGYERICQHLNKNGFNTVKGKEFNSTAVMRLYKRYVAEKEGYMIKIVA